MLVVMPKSRRLGRHAAAAIRMKVRADFPVDMLVRDECEVETRVRNQDLFMLDVTEKGKVMYEAVRTSRVKWRIATGGSQPTFPPCPESKKSKPGLTRSHGRSDAS